MHRPDRSPSPLTVCVHAGADPEPRTGAVMQPIYQVSTYAQAAPGDYPLYDYARAGNPTRTAVEQALAQLEGARYGLSFASGLAATQAVVQCLEPGDHVLVSDDAYGGTGRLFLRLFAKFGMRFEFVDMTDHDVVRAALTPTTRLLWVETPTNPLLKLVDVAAMAELARSVGARVVVDNTFATPIFQRPLELGADVVVHSTTKYIGGHSDFIGGALMTSDDALHEHYAFVQFAAGSVPAPLESFLLHRSIKTLALRMAQHERNAQAVAELLAEHPRVEWVAHPGLPTHPGHALARRQMRGFSGMVSFRLAGGYDDVLRVLSRLRMFVLAESLGGVESLVNHPERMTHASVAPERRAQLGIGPTLLRLSCGIEATEDLLDDLRAALDGP